MPRSKDSFNNYSVSGLNHDVQEEGEMGHRLNHLGDVDEWNYDKKFHNGEESNMNTEAIDWPEDEDTYGRVCDALFRDRVVDKTEVTVDVKDGIVTLSGAVSDRQARLHAVQCIENVFGVINVVNNLTLKRDRGLVGNSEGWPV